MRESACRSTSAWFQRSSSTLSASPNHRKVSAPGSVNGVSLRPSVASNACAERSPTVRKASRAGCRGPCVFILPIVHPDFDPDRSMQRYTLQYAVPMIDIAPFSVRHASRLRHPAGRCDLARPIRGAPDRYRDQPGTQAGSVRNARHRHRQRNDQHTHDAGRRADPLTGRLGDEHAAHLRRPVSALSGAGRAAARIQSAATTGGGPSVTRAQRDSSSPVICFR